MHLLDICQLSLIDVNVKSEVENILAQVSQTSSVNGTEMSTLSSEMQVKLDAVQAATNKLKATFDMQVYEGERLKDDTRQVYLVLEGQLRGIESEDTYVGLFGEDTDAEYRRPWKFLSVFDGMMKGSLLRAGNPLFQVYRYPEVYLIDGTTKRVVKDSPAFCRKYGFDIRGLDRVLESERKRSDVRIDELSEGLPLW